MTPHWFDQNRGKGGLDCGVRIIFRLLQGFSGVPGLRSTGPEVCPARCDDWQLHCVLVGDGAQHQTGWPFSQVIPQLAGEIQVYCAVRLSVDWGKSGNRLDSE